MATALTVAERVAQANNVAEFINDPTDCPYTTRSECQALRREYESRCCGLFACCTYSMGRGANPHHVFADLKRVNRYVKPIVAALVVAAIYNPNAVMATAVVATGIAATVFGCCLSCTRLCSDD